MAQIILTPANEGAQFAFKAEFGFSQARFVGRRDYTWLWNKRWLLPELGAIR